MNTTDIITQGSIEQMERASIDMQIATAKRYPRNVKAASNAIMAMATMDEETATSCFYSLPRGGKSIQGPSVRLAEIAVACYGNIRAGSRIISTDTSSETPHVAVQSVAHDLETNVAVTIEKRRRITPRKNRDGTTFVDEDAVNLAVNACSAIAFRDAAFKVIPRAVITPALNAARSVSVGETRSLVANRAKVLKRLNQMGVTDDRICAAVGVSSVIEIDEEKLADLIGIGTSIRDGQTTIEEAFPEVGETQKPKTETSPAPAPEPAKKSETLADAITWAGFNFEEFRTWAQETDALQNADALGSFDDISPADQSRLYRVRAAIIKGMTAIRENGGGK